MKRSARIAARTAYQVITHRIREAERDVIFDDYESKVDTLVTGTVQRFERGSLIVNLGRTEAILPRQEKRAFLAARGEHKNAE